jgi:hypothetical protein
MPKTMMMRATPVATTTNHRIMLHIIHNVLSISLYRSIVNFYGDFWTFDISSIGWYCISMWRVACSVPMSCAEVLLATAVCTALTLSDQTMHSSSCSRL